MLRQLRLLPLLLALPLLGSCTWFSGDSRVFVSSDPQGAEVLVDGQPTGKTTPAELDLGGMFGGDHQITVRKKGYEPEVRKVSHYTRWGTSRWADGVSVLHFMPLPVWWDTGDFLFPFYVKWVYVPHNLHVKLFPEGTFHPKPSKDTVGQTSDPKPPAAQVGDPKASPGGSGSASAKKTAGDGENE